MTAKPSPPQPAPLSPDLRARRILSIETELGAIRLHSGRQVAASLRVTGDHRSLVLVSRDYDGRARGSTTIPALEFAALRAWMREVEAAQPATDETAATGRADAPPSGADTEK